ncbi:hypothetical protein [Hymenobacter glacialis]|uniref:Uncharacterized protein n=1 Tax=Hymenobacter glacialis TaxID=1908236 RepID=A0A1G1SZB8_9BACT|nr:hypothetical protein [Hymenobacter glacialis]OGX83973.1 hypothetical protein BEN48_16665 [Hymenobacter glacialis]
MQLEDLRQSWLNAPAETAPINRTQLDALLASRPGLVDKMYRNARWETAFAVLFTMAGPVMWVLTTAALHKAYAVITLVLGSSMLYYYYRMFAVLDQMRLVEGDVRGHLQRLVAGMRTLLRFYYRFTLVIGPLLMLMNFGYFLGLELMRPAPLQWPVLLRMAGVTVVAAVLLQVLAVYLTRWFMQRLYGQHLDRFESNLAELDAAS